MSSLFPAKVTFDVQSFLERLPTDRHPQTVRLLSTLFRIIKITKTLNITVAFHESNIPPEFSNILSRVKFNTVITKDYSEFSSFTDSNTILVTKDKIFYQFLKSYENARILNLINSEFVYYTADAMDIRYGYYYHDDFILWSSSIPSKRLNFPGVFKANLRQANFFNRKIYHDNNQHRFYQRPSIFLPQLQKTKINFPKELFLDYPVIDLIKLDRILINKYGSLHPFFTRIQSTLKRSLFARENLSPKKSKGNGLY